MLETFAERLRFALANAGLSPGQLDRVIGWAPGATEAFLSAPEGMILMANWIHFLREVPRTLDVSSSWLFEGKPTPEAARAAAEMKVQAEGKLRSTDIEKMIRFLETL